MEPLEEVIDLLKEQLSTRHVLRMQQGKCSIQVGFVWSDLLTDLERSSDHCSNIAGYVLEPDQSGLRLHETLYAVKHTDPAFASSFRRYAEKYALE